MSDFEVVARLLLSLVCGGIVGYQREAVDRPAGFRTHVLVCVGSTLVTLLSIDGFKGADPSRVAAQIVTGIGFLGAGTIIRQGSIVKGLTTAASIWTVAGIGMGAGAGYYLGTVFTTIVVFLILSSGKRMETELISRTSRKNLIVRGVDKPGQLGRIDAVLEKNGVNVRNVSLEEQDEGESVVKLELKLPLKVKKDAVVSQILEIPGVEEAFWEDAL